MKNSRFNFLKYLAIATVVVTAISLLLIFWSLIDYESIEDHIATWSGSTLNAGQLDLSKGLYQLKGQVIALENQLISPYDQGAIDKLLKDSSQLVSLPFSWSTNQGVDYGTYLLRLEDLVPGGQYGLYLMDVSTAYTLFMDGKVVASQGVPAKIKHEAISASRVQAGFFRAQGDRATMVIHISGHDSHVAGIWQKVLLGSQEQVHNYALKARQADAIMVGAMLVMALYFWTMYLIMRKDRAILYFALLCTLVLVKTLYSGQQIGFTSLPFIKYSLGLKLAYIMVPMLVSSMIAFVGEIFKEIISPIVKRMTYLLSFVQIIVIAITAQRFYQSTFIAYQVLATILALTLIYWLIKAIAKGLQGSLIYFLGYLCFLLIAVNDILYSLLIIHTGYYLSLGLFVLILSQASLLALRIQKAFDAEAYLNANLERLVEARTQELIEEKNKFEELSKVDSLTHLYNKGYLLDMLQFEMESYKRYHGDLAILMIDLDHFKRVNDTYGHIVGDQVLIEIAKTMKSMARKTDILGRFGGEEFMIILRFTTLEEALEIAEILRLKIEACVHHGLAARPFNVTASIGVTVAHKHVADELSLIHEADQALYRAKDFGRNNVKSPVYE